MRFALLGDQGMLGSEIAGLMNKLGFDYEGFNRLNFDTNATSFELANFFQDYQVVINAIAFTQVDKAETLIDEATAINAFYPGALAIACAKSGSRLIHVSTDYVFNGDATNPYKTSEKTDPQSAYGLTKAMGESLVQESEADYTILRTAWLYGAQGRCFPKVMANLLKEKGSVRVVGDQFGQPTWTRDLAEQVIRVAQLDEMPRIVHAVSSGQASWADFAREVAKSLGMDESVVDEITTAEYPTPAKRPAWSVLDNSSDVLEPIGDWRERWAIAAESVLAAR